MANPGNSGEEMQSALAGYVGNVALWRRIGKVVPKQNRRTRVSERRLGSPEDLLRGLDADFSGVLLKRDRFGRKRPRRTEVRGTAAVYLGASGAPRVHDVSRATVRTEAVAGGEAARRRFVVRTATGACLTWVAEGASAAAALGLALRRAAAVPRVEDFAVVRKVGSGGYGHVFEAVHVPSGTRVAVKAVNVARTTHLSHIVAERRALQAASGSAHLGGALAALRSGEGHLLFVLPMGATDLFEYQRVRGRMSEREAAGVAVQLAEGIRHLHARGFLHRDIKIENVLLADDGTASLIDFGLAAQVGADGYARDHVGTDSYMPPEMLQAGMGHRHPVDWWQLGCLLYELVAGRPPFYTADKSEQRRRIREDDVVFSARVRARVSADFVDLVTRLLDKNFATRLGTRGGAAEVLAHPALAGVRAAGARGAYPAPHAVEGLVRPAIPAPAGTSRAGRLEAWERALKPVSAWKATADRLVGFDYVSESWVAEAEGSASAGADARARASQPVSLPLVPAASDSVVSAEAAPSVASAGSGSGSGSGSGTGPAGISSGARHVLVRSRRDASPARERAGTRKGGSSRGHRSRDPSRDPSRDSSSRRPSRSRSLSSAGRGSRDTGSASRLPHLAGVCTGVWERDGSERDGSERDGSERDGSERDDACSREGAESPPARLERAIASSALDTVPSPPLRAVRGPATRDRTATLDVPGAALPPGPPAGLRRATTEPVERSAAVGGRRASSRWAAPRLSQWPAQARPTELVRRFSGAVGVASSLAGLDLSVSAGARDVSAAGFMVKPATERWVGGAAGPRGTEAGPGDEGQPSTAVEPVRMGIR